MRTYPQFPVGAGSFLSLSVEADPHSYDAFLSPADVRAVMKAYARADGRADRG